MNIRKCLSRIMKRAILAENNISTNISLNNMFDASIICVNSSADLINFESPIRSKFDAPYS
ncbi:hypothetical protein DERP_009666 [Dermatophagoides pteronyssinus]|uniref:Uncharacterized protein n=1 Tax=Dermatophagoides pteronyssinus TaxID=6956 RepID=A0ABQ8JAM0_DERPT|nr:hypothetical protein DERP_009666 [Dermatophagoides pteronyssinus]